MPVNWPADSRRCLGESTDLSENPTWIASVKISHSSGTKPARSLIGYLVSSQSITSSVWGIAGKHLDHTVKGWQCTLHMHKNTFLIARHTMVVAWTSTMLLLWSTP